MLPPLVYKFHGRDIGVLLRRLRGEEVRAVVKKQRHKSCEADLVVKENSYIMRQILLLRIMLLADLLKQFGLNEKETALFLQIAHMGSAPASTLAHKLHLKRTSCYQMLEDMVRRGFIKRTIVGNIRYYMAKTLVELERMLDKRVAALQEIQEQLGAHREEFQDFYGAKKKKTEVTFYEGFDEIAKIYELMVEQEDDTIYSIIEKQSSEQHVLQKFWQWYRKTRIVRGKKSVSLVNAVSDAEAYIRQSRKNKRRVGVIPNDDIQLFGDIKVCGDILAIMSPYKGRIWGVTIEDPEIAEMFRGVIRTLEKTYAKRKA